MSETMAQTVWKSETLEWAEVEGKHAEMHLLRQAAIVGSRAVMQHVGINSDNVEIETARGTERIIISNPITLPHTDSEGVEQEARIQKTSYCYKMSEPCNRGPLSRLMRRGESRLSQIERYKPQFSVVQTGGDRPPSVTKMMTATQLDVRPNLEWSSGSMIDYYDGQIESIKFFMDKIEKLAELRGAYMYSPHISELLEDQQAEA
ncbi:MAG TPA: hypothetical protein VFH99_03815 [Candidatus Saccharimonadales bacterium]|nr:hypothetical protein [Candidatus Saccharimonadales bacterium]